LFTTSPATTLDDEVSSGLDLFTADGVIVLSSHLGCFKIAKL